MKTTKKRTQASSKTQKLKKAVAKATRALRYNEEKTQWHLMDMKLFEGFIRVMQFGAKKYAPDNWRKGSPVSELTDCLNRHIVSFQNGEDIDAESGQSHLDHAICNLMFLKNVEQHASLKKRFDDRRKPLK